MQDLLNVQIKIEQDIEKLLSNFKKESKERRTQESIRRRLETLELLWKEYTENHYKLLLHLSKDHDYLLGDYFEKTRKTYLETREYIEKRSIINPVGQEKASGDQEPIYPEETGEYIGKDGPSGSISVSQQEGKTAATSKSSAGTNSKLDELLKKQLSNFKAFTRTVSSIKLETMNEKWEFEDTLKSIQARWSAIDSIHWEIDSELDGSNKMYEDRFTEHEQKYYDAKKAINSKLWSVSHREKSTPQLDIPVFNGNYQQWVSFKDLFCEAIHNNPSISNAQKLQFLKSKLKGEAERLIQHLQISSENYLTAWEILNHRYNNKKLIFTTHMNTLMNLPLMQQASSNNIKRIHDVTTECLNAIKNLGVNIETWDPILVHILVQKLDSETHADYLDSLKQPRELPSLHEFLTFMENKFTTMESARKKHENQQQKSTPSTSYKQERSYNYKYYSSNKATLRFGNSKLSCPICKSTEHGIYYCKQFLEQSPSHKRQTIMNLNLCANCLFSHCDKACTSNKRCRECNGCHNTILHAAYSKGNSNVTPNGATQRSGPSNFPTDTRPWSEQTRQNNVSHVAQQCDTQEILLTTALIKVQGVDGEYRKMRALIDQGSQVSLITENAAQMLRIPRRKCRGIITGVGTKDNTCTGMLNITCSSLTEDFTFKTEVYIMKSLTRNLPNCSFAKPSWDFLQDIQLADPEFNMSSPIDILFGADIYSHIILAGICKSGNLTPVAQQTRLGWILCGKVPTLQCNVVINQTEELHKFWEIEDIADSTHLSTEESQCVNLYKSTTTRLSDGKYQVRLPLKSSVDQLGQSKNKAVAQFLQLERKLNKNQDMEKEYKLFIHEYQELGHMKLADANSKPEFYLPHHCVLREESTTTSHRVVFNASQTTSNGESLNDCMYKGPNLQKDLLSLILVWRQYKVAFTADIEKMFRQIWVHEQDQALQKIVWRDDPRELLREYQLTTVTYGTKAAPFLAMMTLRQLADDERQNFPEAAQVVENSFYMDDLLHGSHSLNSAQKLKKDLIDLMKAGGCNLRKWSSNYQELQGREQQDQDKYSFKQMESTKTLGLYWNPNQDAFTFQTRIPNNENKTKPDTKRSLLSDISKQFDPLGWLSPLSTKLKLLFQKVWKTNMAWDDRLPEDIELEWRTIKDDIDNINQIKIRRWLGSDATCKIELHGFCDASQKAYACVIYIKIVKTGQQAEINLVAGKSRLVPCNKEISLPRLELSGALLLSKLMNTVIQALSSNSNIKVYGWIDSTAVLGWLQGNPDRWKLFVTNRVREITKTMPSDCWRYVKTSENPADCASRGLTATQLKQHPLWWQGPNWLPTYDVTTKQENPTYTTNEEEKKSKQVNVLTQDPNSSIIKDLLNKYSSLSKVVRVLAWVRRFIAKKQDKQLTTWLTLSEIRKAKEYIIKKVQSEVFKDELRDLQKTKQVSSKSKISNLTPFLDENQVLRVGGRLQHAFISTEMKNPAILPQNHRLTELIISYAHELTFHGGARVTLAFARQKYWILSGNRTTKKYIRKCVTCRRQAPTMNKQIMGHMPEPRVNPSRPFKHTGVDFTGHVLLKANKGRGIKTSKGYVAVFVCMVTKATHLELVSDMSTSAFIAALRRMAARRGTPEHIYCDNGSNFVGASRILQEEYQEIQQIFNDELQKELTDMEIKFHFNAPSWPSAGGLWEAAVKSFKFHLKRVVGEQKLTYEEYTTILSQIEACLNSRPLCALSEDPEDLNYLTPSHFLANGPMLTLIETERDLRTRWQLTQKILQDLWKRWRAEYLSQLTARSKWRQPHKNISIDDVVIVHNDNLPPGKWIMGRVVELHPGKDGHVRVVTLKTKSGYVRRPVIKLSILTGHEDYSKNNSDKTESNEQAKSANKPKRTRKNNTTFFTSMFTALLFFLSIITSSECILNVTKFRENQGLYFDKVSDMLLIKDEWKLVVYYEMGSYWHGNNALNTYMKALEKACNTMREQAHCNAILLQLRHGYTELQYYNQMLQSQQVREQSIRQTARRRRGLINGVGYLANSLFGVLDERFADQYKEDISKLQGNQNHIIQLWRNQTSIIESENNLLKRTEFVMNQQYKIMNQHLLLLEQALDRLKDEAQANSDVNDFAIGSIIASNVLNNLKNLQNTLLETVTDTYQGRFNLHLLTPEQLIAELSTISSKLPRDVSLPVENIHADLRKLYSLITVKTRIGTEFLLFEIRIPLIGRETYEILKIIPIPKLQANKAISIVPVSDYVALNLKKDTFITMSEVDVRACVAQSETYFCHSQKPEYLMKNENNLCEMDTQECKTRSSLCTDKWQDSYAMNTYIYFCCEQCQVRAMCEDRVTTHQLTSAGLINLGHGCIIKTDTFTIYPHKPHISEVRLSPKLYTPTMAPINHIFNLTIPQLQITNKSHLELEQENSDIQDKIRDLKEHEALPENVSYHNVHHYVMIYILVSLIMFTGIIMIFRHTRAGRQANRTSRIESNSSQRDGAGVASGTVEADSPPSALPRSTEGVSQGIQTKKIIANASARFDKSTSPVLKRFSEVFQEGSP